MPDPEARHRELIALLKAHGFRMTPQRMELLRLIAVSKGHPSAAQIYAQIKTTFPAMSYATVYKTLALLKDLNQVLEIEMREDSHYDGNRPQPHPHLICVKCNQIIDGEIFFDPEALEKLEKVTGYSILRLQINLYGLCPNCKEDS